MAPALFLIFNHQLTPDQALDARIALGVGAIVEPPSDLQQLWSDIPPELEELSGYVAPIGNWLAEQATSGDYVLVQGDFGACCLVVTYALERGLVPIYSTTRRKMSEERLPDGTIRMVHHFQHVRFRRYGQ